MSLAIVNFSYQCFFVSELIRGTDIYNRHRITREILVMIKNGSILIKPGQKFAIENQMTNYFKVFKSRQSL